MENILNHNMKTLIQMNNFTNLITFLDIENSLYETDFEYSIEIHSNFIFAFWISKSKYIFEGRKTYDM